MAVASVSASLLVLGACTSPTGTAARSGGCPLGGTWTGTLPSGAMAGSKVTAEFAADGTYSSVVGATTMTGLWTLSGDELTFIDKTATPPAAPCPTSGRYRLTPSAGCTQVTFTKVADTCPGRSTSVDGITLTRVKSCVDTLASQGGALESPLQQGTYLMAVETPLNDKTKLLLLRAKVSGVTSTNFDLVLEPLVPDNKTPARTVCGPAITLKSVKFDASGKFVLSAPNLSIPGACNPISDFDILASVTLTGAPCPGGADALCGTMDGSLVKPQAVPLTSSTFGLVPAAAMSAAVPVWSCTQCPKVTPPVEPPGSDVGPSVVDAGGTSTGSDAGVVVQDAGGTSTGSDAGMVTTDTGGTAAPETSTSPTDVTAPGLHMTSEGGERCEGASQPVDASVSADPGPTTADTGVSAKKCISSCKVGADGEVAFTHTCGPLDCKSTSVSDRVTVTHCEAADGAFVHCTYDYTLAGLKKIQCLGTAGSCTVTPK